MRKAYFLIVWAFLPSQFQTGYNSRRRKMVTGIFYHPQHLIPFGTMWQHLVLIVILILFLIIIGWECIFGPVLAFPLGFGIMKGKKCPEEGLI